MSAQVAYKYASYGTGTYGLPPEEVFIPGAEPDVVPGALPDVDSAPETRTRPQVQTRYSISLFGITGFILVSAMLLLVILANVKLSEVSFQNVALEKQMQVLSMDERRLLIKYEKAFDINQIEEYATTVLGMAKPAESQVGQIDAKPQDKIVILNNDNKGESAFEGFASFLRSLVAYFG